MSLDRFSSDVSDRASPACGFVAQFRVEIIREFHRGTPHGYASIRIDGPARQRGDGRGKGGTRRCAFALVETSLVALEPLGTAAKPLRDLAMVVRGGVR